MSSAKDRQGVHKLGIVIRVGNLHQPWWGSLAPVVLVGARVPRPGSAHANDQPAAKSLKTSRGEHQTY